MSEFELIYGEASTIKLETTEVTEDFMDVDLESVGIKSEPIDITLEPAEFKAQPINVEIEPFVDDDETIAESEPLSSCIQAVWLESHVQCEFEKEDDNTEFCNIDDDPLGRIETGNEIPEDNPNIFRIKMECEDETYIKYTVDDNGDTLNEDSNDSNQKYQDNITIKEESGSGDEVSTMFPCVQAELTEVEPAPTATNGMVCKFCDKVFYNVHEFYMHARRHSSGEPITTYKKKEQKKKRSIVSRRVTGYICKCKFCKFTFNSPNALYNHTKKHKFHKIQTDAVSIASHNTNDDLILVCKFCNMRFADVQTLYLHAKDHKHSVQDLPNELFRVIGEQSDKIKISIDTGINCKFCNMQFADVMALYTHSKVHSERKNRDANISDNQGVRQEVKSVFNCSLCSEEFSQRLSLFLHEWEHTDANTYSQYKCSDCRSLYWCKSSLDSHICVQRVAKPYLPCHTCAAQFMSERTLLNHCIERHVQSKANKNKLQRFRDCYKKGKVCGVSGCRKLCVSLFTWERHVSSHKGFVCCSLCNQRFKTVEQVQEHEQKEHTYV